MYELEYAPPQQNESFEAPRKRKRKRKHKRKSPKSELQLCESESAPSHSVTLSPDNFFQSLRVFNGLCLRNKRLTPETQLIYRVLIDYCNRLFWTDSFTASDSDIAKITHLSKDAITAAKRRLKNLGVLTYSGKPTNYTLYSLTGNSPGYSPGNTADPPAPPRGNTSIHKYPVSKKKLRKEERCEPHVDIHDLDADQPRPAQTPDPAELTSRITDKLKLLRRNRETD